MRQCPPNNAQVASPNTIAAVPNVTATLPASVQRLLEGSKLSPAGEKLHADLLAHPDFNSVRVKKMYDQAAQSSPTDQARALVFFTE